MNLSPRLRIQRGLGAGPPSTKNLEAIADSKNRPRHPPRTFFTACMTGGESAPMAAAAQVIAVRKSPPGRTTASISPREVESCQMNSALLPEIVAGSRRKNAS